MLTHRRDYQAVAGGCDAEEQLGVGPSHRYERPPVATRDLLHGHRHRMAAAGVADGDALELGHGRDGGGEWRRVQRNKAPERRDGRFDEVCGLHLTKEQAAAQRQGQTAG